VASRWTDLARTPEGHSVREPARRAGRPISPITVAVSRRSRCRNGPLAASRLASSLRRPTRRQSSYRRCAGEANNRSRPPAHSTGELKLAIDGAFSATLDATKNTYQLVRLGVAKRVTDLTPQMRLVPLRPATKLWDGTPPSPPNGVQRALQAWSLSGCTHSWQSSSDDARGRRCHALAHPGRASCRVSSRCVGTDRPSKRTRRGADYPWGGPDRNRHGGRMCAYRASRLSLAIWAAIACVARLDRSCSCC
jgi:hypothetical protein